MKKIFITGAGSGLGKEAAIELARRGHTVYATVYYQDQLKPLEEIARSEKIDLKIFKLDITKIEDQNLVSNFDIDVFISNAAIGNSGSVIDTPIDKIKEVFDTNVFDNVSIIQCALKNMIKRKQGRIIIISSLVGRIPLPFLSPYCASKSALESFGICLNQELKIINKLSNTNITVSLVEPGAYATGFNKEDSNPHFRYYAPWWQAFLVQIGRIIGM